jgi:serine/threonine kinase PknH
MARIFITYARENRSEVEALTADLGRLGHDVWYDAEIRGGQHWWDEILRRIAGCDIYVFAMTEPAIDSRPCIAELDYAVAAARPLLPVQLETVSPALLPRTLAEAQFVDYRSADKDCVFALNSALNTMPAQTPLPDPMPPPPEIPPDPVAQAKERIDDPTEMTRSTQLELVDVLGHELRVHGHRRDVASVLWRLRSRIDVMGEVRDRIDALLKEDARGPGPEAAAAGTVEDTAPAEPPAEDAPAAESTPPTPPIAPLPTYPPPVSPTPTFAPPQPRPQPQSQFVAPRPQPHASGPPVWGQPAAQSGWTSGFMTTMIVLGVLCGGLVPLVVGLTGLSEPAKKDQAKTLILVGGIILGISFLLLLAYGLSQPQPEPSGF